MTGTADKPPVTTAQQIPQGKHRRDRPQLRISDRVRKARESTKISCASDWTSSDVIEGIRCDVMRAWVSCCMVDEREIHTVRTAKAIQIHISESCEQSIRVSNMARNDRARVRTNVDIDLLNNGIRVFPVACHICSADRVELGKWPSAGRVSCAPSTLSGVLVYLR